MQKVLVVDDEKLITDLIRINLEKEGYAVTALTSSKEALKVLESTEFSVVVLDLMMPQINGLELLKHLREKSPLTQAVMITAHGSIDTAVKAMRLGAFDYLTKPFSQDDLLLTVAKAAEFYDNSRGMQHLRQEVKRTSGLSSIIGESPSLESIRRQIRKIVDADARVVMIEGESGVGKEVVAKAIHAEGRRSTRPFVAINCASMPENLLESELFGHEKGAFTDAKAAKQGLFEYADGGTVFLDEIGDMPLNLQAKMLRFLEDRQIRKVGGLASFTVDVQVVAATNKNLRRLVGEERFRDDLYYRIQVVPLYIPPLRERKEDIITLSQHFIRQFNAEFNKHIKGFAPIAQKMILGYDWPGNVRELRNLIERAMIFEDSDMIMVERLSSEIITMANRSSRQVLDIKIPFSGIDIEMVEEDLVRQALTIARGNQSKAARLLSIGVDAMRYRMKKYGMLK